MSRVGESIAEEAKGDITFFQNWSKEAALDELKNGGYGYHSIYGNIPKFIAQADIAWYRRELGLGAGLKAGVGQ